MKILALLCCALLCVQANEDKDSTEDGKHYSHSSSSSEENLQQFVYQQFYPKNSLKLTKHNDKTYFFSRTQKMTWMNAMSFCRAYSMDLVSVETLSKNIFLSQKLAEYGMSSEYVWISGHRIGRPRMAWINGKPLQYQNWQTGEPSAPATEACMIISQGKWWDFGCDGQAFFICEQTPWHH